MIAKVHVECVPGGINVGNLRTILCECQRSKKDVNPLIDTNFNAELAIVVQQAFDEGRRYQRNNPDKDD